MRSVPAKTKVGFVVEIFNMVVLLFRNVTDWCIYTYNGQKKFTNIYVNCLTSRRAASSLAAAFRAVGRRLDRPAWRSPRPAPCATGEAPSRRSVAPSASNLQYDYAHRAHRRWPRGVVRPAVAGYG